MKTVQALRRHTITNSNDMCTTANNVLVLLKYRPTVMKFAFPLFFKVRGPPPGCAEYRPKRNIKYIRYIYIIQSYTTLYFIRLY